MLLGVLHPFVERQMTGISARSARWGAIGAVGMASFYALVVGGLSDSVEHLFDQIRLDWYLLVPIIAGFGVQIAGRSRW